MKTLLLGPRLFKRRLPRKEQLYDPKIVRVFRTALTDGSVRCLNSEGKLGQSDPLYVCFAGWLQSDFDSTADLFTVYTFPSPLHQSYVSTLLWKDDNIYNSGGATLQKFAIEVVKRFSYINLFADRRLGPCTIQRTPEAQYQDEFYCIAYDLTNGELIQLPELGDESGHINFFIPSLGWGVERNAVEIHVGIPIM